MNTPTQPKLSEFSIGQIRVINFNFKQLNDVSNGDTIYLNTGLTAEYIHQKESRKIQPVLSIQVIMSKGEKTDNVVDDKNDIAVFKGRIVGDVSYTADELDEKILPNIMSILYSYLRPVVAQMSVMAKLPPVDLPILDLRNIVVRKIENNEKVD